MPNELVLLAARFPIPEAAGSGIHFAGQRRSAMTSNAFAREFVLPTALAIVLGVLLSIGAIYLLDHLMA